MSDLATVLAALDTAVATLCSSTRCNHDYRDDLDVITAGSTKHQLRAQPEAPLYQNISETYETGSVEVEIHHNLADPTDPQAYTDANLLTHGSSLVDPDWWRAISGVRSVEGFDGAGIAFSIDVRREGNIISWGVQAKFSIEP